jgi:hypothetical protein
MTTTLTQPASPTVQVRGLAAHPVAASFVAGLVLHLLWWLVLANSGGDIAAQDAWAEFARAHPGSAYNLSWYGGMHAASYSLISPFVMAALGVRTTMVIAGAISSALLALLLVPSLVSLFGSWNWKLPDRVARLLRVPPSPAVREPGAAATGIPSQADEPQPLASG